MENGPVLFPLPSYWPRPAVLLACGFWGRGNVRRFLNNVEVDLVPRNSQSGALNGVYQFQHIGVSHFTGPFHILTPSVPKALVPALPQAVSVTQAGTCKAPAQRSPGAP